MTTDLRGGQQYGYIISRDELEKIKRLFWIIYCDEVRDNKAAEDAAYNVLKALETYRKVVQGETPNVSGS